MARTQSPNHNLIGVQGGRARLSTPALVLDLPTFEKNIQAMARHCQGTGQVLRPHGKSHKCVEIARRQQAAGAIGICCATIREAEAMVGADLVGVLITSPLTGEAKIARLMALHAKSLDLMVVTDSLINCEMLSRAADAASAGHPLRVLVDFDVGLQRTGAPDHETALRIAAFIDSQKNLSFAGFQAYAGHLQHVVDWEERASLANTQAERVRGLVDSRQAKGLDVPLVTGGGTGTHDIDHRTGVFDELQAGSYIFTDVDYNRVPLRQGNPRPFEPALFVQATVINGHFDSHAVIDAGLKSFATDGPEPVFAAGAPDGATYRFMGDEHGAVVYPKGSNTRLDVGDSVSLVIPHCDPTVNLYDWFHCVDGDTLVDIWPVDARGNP